MHDFSLLFMKQHSDEFKLNSTGFSNCFSMKGLLCSNRILCHVNVYI